jgi:hypothetical protein
MNADKSAFICVHPRLRFMASCLCPYRYRVKLADPLAHAPVFAVAAPQAVVAFVAESLEHQAVPAHLAALVQVVLVQIALAQIGPVHQVVLEQVAPAQRHAHPAAVGIELVWLDARLAPRVPDVLRAVVPLAVDDHVPAVAVPAQRDVLHVVIDRAPAPVQVAVALELEPARLAARRVHARARHAPGTSVPSHDLTPYSRASLLRDPAGMAAPPASCW